MLLPSAAEFVGVKSTPEDLPLRTVHQDIWVLHDHTGPFHVSPAASPQTSYRINGAFTASRFNRAQYTYPVDRLQKSNHLCSIPIPALSQAKPSLLIGSYLPHLIRPVETVLVHLVVAPSIGQLTLLLLDELYKHVERLRQVLPA